MTRAQGSFGVNWWPMPSPWALGPRDALASFFICICVCETVCVVACFIMVRKRVREIRGFLFKLC